MGNSFAFQTLKSPVFRPLTLTKPWESPKFGADEPTPPPKPKPVKLPPVQPENYDGITWSFKRPQTTDTLVGPKGQTTKVTSLIDGGQIFTTIDSLMTQAKDSVLLDLYELTDGQLQPGRTSPVGTPGYDKQQKIVQNLIELAKKGVKVKVVLDNSYDDEKKAFHNQKTLEYLNANGVEALAYPRDGAKINHVKMMVVDGKSAVIGGMNWGNHSAVNHDACVMLEGDDVANLAEQIFKVDYKYSGGDVKTLPKFKTVPEAKIKVLTTSQSGSPDGGHNEIFEEILERIENAKSSVICELFTLTDKQVAQKLVDAHKRLTENGKPGVRVIVDPGLYLKFKNCRPAVDYLKAQGVPVRFYRVNWENEEKLHAKWAVFDEEHLLIGSANWSKTGLQSSSPSSIGYNSQLQFDKGNHEANVLVQSKQISKAFLRQFDYDWTRKSTPMFWAKGIINLIPEGLRDKFMDMKPGTFPPKPVPNPDPKKPPTPKFGQLLPFLKSAS